MSFLLGLASSQTQNKVARFMVVIARLSHFHLMFQWFMGSIQQKRDILQQNCARMRFRLCKFYVITWQSQNEHLHFTRARFLYVCRSLRRTGTTSIKGISAIKKVVHSFYGRVGWPTVGQPFNCWGVGQLLGPTNSWGLTPHVRE